MRVATVGITGIISLPALLSFLLAGCPAKVASVEVAPTKLSFKSENDQKVLKATAKDEGGTALADKVPVWKSSDPAVATVSSDGSVKAAGSGKATITATIEELSGTATVEVQLLKSIKLEAPAIVVTIGTPAPPLRVSLMNERGEPINVADAKIAWKTSDAAIATIAADGTVSGVAPGSTLLVASINDLKAEAAVTVNGPSLSEQAAADADAAKAGQK